MTLKEVCAGKWGYGPFDGDSALDFAWELERQLLGQAANLDSNRAFVILELLTHIDNNSVDENQEKWRSLRRGLLHKIREEAPHHRDPNIFVHERLDIIDKLDRRILTDSGQTSKEDPVQLSQEEHQEMMDLRSAFSQEGEKFGVLY